MSKYEKYAHLMPMRFMGTDIELYEVESSDFEIYNQLDDINGSTIRKITKKEAFDLIDWPRGFMFRLIYPEYNLKGEEIGLARKLITTDIDLNIIRNGKGKLMNVISVLQHKYGKDKVSLKQTDEIIIYGL
jgi:hypothetical protein